jgi:hypothetical protein
MIKVSNEVPLYEVNGSDVGVLKEGPLIVEAHWNRCEFVRIKHGDLDVTVCAKDILAAIANATNTSRF